MSKRVSEAVAPSITPGQQGGESAPLRFTEGAGAVLAKGASGTAAPTDAATRAALVANKIDSSTSEVVRWGNGEAVGAETIKLTDDDATPVDKPAEKPSAKPAKTTKEDAETEPVVEEETAEEDTPAAAKPTAGADKRRQILESLDREAKRVDVESRIKEEQTKREAAEAKLAEFEKSPLGRKLATIAKQHGMSLDDLKDKLLIGADDVLDKPDAEPAKPAKDPEVAALLEWKAARERAEGDAKIAQSVDHVRGMLKDADLPMVDAFDAYNRVMVKAHAGWMASGKKETVQDYIPSAAELVEEELKAERPAAARRLYPAAAEEATEEAETPVAKPTPRPAMGKRQAARPGTKPSPLPFDPEERDRAIKKRYGWG
jgi:hypothetical protein